MDAWTITVNGEDLSAYVDATTIRIRKKVGFRRNTAEFVIRNQPNTLFTYHNWAEVMIWRDTALEFGGVMMAYDHTDLGVNRDTRVTCVDYSVLLDARLASANSVYPINRAGQTVVDLITAEAPEITAALVDDGGYVEEGEILGEITIDYKPLADVLRDMAIASGFTYYVQQSAVDPYPINFYFHAVGGQDAPFGLTTNSPDGEFTYAMAVRTWTAEGTSVRNKVYIQYSDGVVEAGNDSSEDTYGYELEMIKRAETADATYASVIAEGLLEAYSEEREAGTVVCWEPGLSVGMRIHIEHVPLAIDDDYIIQEMEIRPDGEQTIYTLTLGEALQDPGLIDRLRAFDALSQYTDGSTGTTQPFVGRREGPHVGMWRRRRADDEYNIFLQAVDTANVPYFSVGSVDYTVNTVWLNLGYADPATGKAPIRLAMAGPGDSETHPALEIEAANLVGTLAPGLGGATGSFTTADDKTVTVVNGLITAIEDNP